MTDEFRAGSRPLPRKRSMDPDGKRALFETPVSAARDTIRAGPAREGRSALYSTGPRRQGTVVVECSACEAGARISAADAVLRMATFSAWLPMRRHAHWMSCPTCHRRTWCRIDWLR